ncbi:MAG: chemotaxis protein MotA [Desulfovibrio sp.]|nr:chemotaxis protein MotA [Desulfovibrio sp.]
MNIATVIGIIFGIGILFYATFLSTDDIRVFINFPGLAIVIGGTLASTFICFPMKEVMRVFSTFLMALKREELPIGNYIEEIVRIAREASARGKIHLEKALPGIENEFLKNAIQMLVDGYSREEIKEILDTRIEQTYQQEISSAGIYRTMAKLSPAYGIIGTLIGLIGMMQSMAGGLSQLGFQMAVALTTTLYGILLANVLFLPVAIKVEKRIEERVILMCVIRDGTLFIKDKTPAAIVLDKLKAYLPPRRWASVGKRETPARAGA